MWNGFGDIPTIRHKLDVLSTHGETEGRDRFEVTATGLGTLIVADSQEKPTAGDAGGRPIATWTTTAWLYG